MVKSPFSPPKSLVSLVKHHFCYLNFPFWSHEPGPFLVTEVVPKRSPTCGEGWSHDLTISSSRFHWKTQKFNMIWLWKWWVLPGFSLFQVSHFCRFLTFPSFSLFQVSHFSRCLTFPSFSLFSLFQVLSSNHSSNP
jgi:hypothetical protein